jgi:hypothetical protein
MIGWKAAPRRWICWARLCLKPLGAIDDATGKVVYAQFRPSEDQIGYLLMLRTVALTHGLPHILYHDRRTILRVRALLAIVATNQAFLPVVTRKSCEDCPVWSTQDKGRWKR